MGGRIQKSQLSAFVQRACDRFDPFVRDQLQNGADPRNDRLVLWFSQASMRKGSR